MSSNVFLSSQRSFMIHSDKTFKLVGFAGNKVDEKKFKKKSVFLNYNFIESFRLSLKL